VLRKTRRLEENVESPRLGDRQQGIGWRKEEAVGQGEEEVATDRAGRPEGRMIEWSEGQTGR
jgi:hypothetical protein